eukprot:scpid57985/ scgid28365/ Methionine--tRNA ligase, mitochondrial; Methionyl-tRNA synthetase 2; Mitochondrial methionyl-tRNA synthetase
MAVAFHKAVRLRSFARTSLNCCFRSASPSQPSFQRNSHIDAGMNRGSPFVTTPIYYVNSSPHIGHVYSTVMADVHYRFRQQEGMDRRDQQLGQPAPMFSTGTDEHGLKIQQAAAAAGSPPLDHCTQLSAQFKTLFDGCDISYTDYIRTTEERHKRAVEHFWNLLVSRGYIYKGSFSGWYSVSDECFVPELQTEVGQDAQGNSCRVSAESGNAVEWLTEENYLFRLTEFMPQLRQWITNNPTVIQPPVSADYIIETMYSDDLQDLSVSRSRSRLAWGMPVPGDDSQTIYVWLDALVNYLTVAGYPDNPNFEQRWPPTLQVVGKDILKFHAIYWPAFLLAAGLKLPEQFLAHSHWTQAGKKMSKSRGNVYPAKDLVENFNSTSIRYYFCTVNCITEESEFSARRFKELYNMDIADQLGNLVMRMSSKKCVKDLVYPPIRLHQLPYFNECDKSIASSWEFGSGLDELKGNVSTLVAALIALPGAVEEGLNTCRVHTPVVRAMLTLRSANAVFHNFEPWQLQKSDAADAQDKLDMCYRLTLEAVIASCIVLRPVILKPTEDILTSCGVDESQWNMSRARRFANILMNKEKDTDVGTPFSRITSIPFEKYDISSQTGV